ncbi:MAG TPA: CAP domain-containing protein [Chitinophagaceae bacterium]|nr:CAP domain-containing protein [Chitinophagaceae bacterium]
MQLRTLPVILLISILFFSCKKNDIITNSNAGTNGNNTTNIVYNVNKADMLQLINNVRAKGCTCGTTVMPPVAALVWNDQLAKAAYDHTADMYTNNYFSHTGLDGSDPGQRITAAGYSWNSYGENIANGYATEQSVMNAWLNSEGHCKNIMNSGFKDIGAGRDGNYWTQDFGSK